MVTKPGFKCLSLEVKDIDWCEDVMVDCAATGHHITAVFGQMKAADYLRKVDDCLSSVLIKVLHYDLVLESIDETVEPSVPDEIVMSTCVHSGHKLKTHDLGIAENNKILRAQSIYSVRKYIILVVIHVEMLLGEV